jgi:hypothetical protein
MWLNLLSVQSAAIPGENVTQEQKSEEQRKVSGFHEWIRRSTFAIARAFMHYNRLLALPRALVTSTVGHTAVERTGAGKAILGTWQFTGRPTANRSMEGHYDRPSYRLPLPAKYNMPSAS